MDPINYALNVQSPVTSLFQGINQANNEMQQQQQIQDNAMMSQAKSALLNQELQDKQYAAAQRQQQQQDVADLINNPNPTAKDFVNFQLKYPQFKDSTQAAWGNLSTEIKQQRLQLAGQVVSSLDGGDKDTAVGLLEQAKQAAVNSGDKAQATALTNQIGLVKNLPAQAARNAVLKFMATVDPDNFEKNYSGLVNTDIQQQKLPAELQKTQAETVKTLDSVETQKLDRQISVLDAQIKSADSETRRGELQAKRDELDLKRQEMQQKTGTTQVDKQNDAQSKLNMYDQNIATVDKVLNSPVMNAFFGVGSVGGKIASWIPGTENRDFDALLQTVKSQQFLSNIQQMKAAGGAGALSDAEGKKLDSAVAAIDRDQSPESLRAALTTIKDILEASRRRAISDPNLPTSGGAFVMNHPQFGQVTEGTINKLLKDHPGSTRAQVLQYLQSSGGK